ncbi:hypothetical protein CRYUN_Cryun08bG0110500 [Craigia yunnanensis]
MRGGSYSYRYSPSPPRGYGRRHCSPSSRGRYEGRGRDLPTSLLVRNLRHDCRFVLSPLFDWFKNALLKTLSSNKYCWKEVGFEFIVKKCKSGRISTQLTFGSQVLLGRELTIVFAEEKRKKPSEMKARERGRHIGTPHFLILDHHVLEVTPAVQTIILLLLGKDVTQEIGDIEGDLTRGLPMAQGVQAGALVGAGAEVCSILGVWFDMDLAIGSSTVELFDCLRSTDLVVHKTKSERKKGENICRQDTASASHAAMMITNIILPNLSITSSSWHCEPWLTCRTSYSQLERGGVVSVPPGPNRDCIT